MNLIVLGLVAESIDKIALSISDCVDDWTAESAIIASNEDQNTPRVSSPLLSVKELMIYFVL